MKTSRKPNYLAPKTKVIDRERVLQKQRRIKTYVDDRRAAQSVTWRVGDLVSVKGIDGVWRSPLAITQVGRTSVRLEDGRVWPMRYISRPRVSQRNKSSERGDVVRADIKGLYQSNYRYSGRGMNNYKRLYTYNSNPPYIKILS